MKLYVKKRIPVPGKQWFKVGDHKEVYDYLIMVEHQGNEYYCSQCGKPFNEHGWVATLEGGHIVCPGDWIMTGVKGEHWPVKPDIFEETYEEYHENDWLA
jgi:hypothetical protein